MNAPLKKLSELTGLAFDGVRSGYVPPDLPGDCRRESTKRFPMAKATTIKVKLVSSADTGFYYVTKKNSRTMTDKLVKKKYDPIAKKHVYYTEYKIK